MDLKRLKHPKLIGKNSECDPISRAKVTQEERKTPNYSEIPKSGIQLSFELLISMLKL